MNKNLRKLTSYTILSLFLLISVLSIHAQTNSVSGMANGAVVASTVTILGVPTMLNMAEAAPVMLPPEGGSESNEMPGVNLGVPDLTVLQTGTIRNTTFGSIDTFGAHAESQSTIDDVNILNGLVTATQIVSVSTSSGNGASATSSGAGSRFQNLVVSGEEIDDEQPPNTVIPISNVDIGLLEVSGTVTINEQLPAGNGTTTSSLQVTQLRVNVTGSSLGGLTAVNADIRLAISSSGVNFTAEPNTCPTVSVAGGTVRSVQVGQTLTFGVSATDPDGDTVTLSASNLPANSSFTPNPAVGTPTAAGTFSFTPSATQANQTFNVSFTASDTSGCIDAVPAPVVVQITVTPGPPPNNCPVVTVAGGVNRSVQVGQSIVFSVSATDQDGDTVSLLASNLPANASFTPNPAVGTPTAAGTFSFTPSSAQANQTFSINFTASDNRGCSGSVPLPVTVQISTTTPPPPPPGNNCPAVTISGGGVRTVAVGQTLTFTVATTDPDGDTVTLTATDLPMGASFNPNPAVGTPTASGVFSFEPSAAQAGQVFTVRFLASDDRGCSGPFQVTVSALITVEGSPSPPNPCDLRPPLISVPSLPLASTNQAIEFVVQSTDQDGSPLIVTAELLPDNAVFDRFTGSFSFKPDAEQLRRARLGQSLVAVLMAVDGRGLISKTKVDVTPVAGTSSERDPVISVPPSPVLVRGVNDRLSFSVAARSQDAGCTVAVSAEGLTLSGSFDTANNVFSFVPSATDIGRSFLVTFNATDCRGRTTMSTVQILVADANADCSPSGTGRIDIGADRIIFPKTLMGDRTGAVSVTLTNRGSGVLVIGSTTISDEINYRIEGLCDTPLMLQPGGVIEFRIFFEPRQKGNREATLVVFSTDPDRPAVEVRLKGKGLKK